MVQSEPAVLSPPLHPSLQGLDFLPLLALNPVCDLRALQRLPLVCIHQLVEHHFLHIFLSSSILLPHPFLTRNSPHSTLVCNRVEDYCRSRQDGYWCCRRRSVRYGRPASDSECP